MNIKSLLFGSVATLFAASGAHAGHSSTDKPQHAKHVEHASICDTYGSGYFNIPGTATCMRISGYVRAEIKGGQNVYARRDSARKRDSMVWSTMATLRSQTKSQTELGPLNTFTEMRSKWKGGGEYGKASTGIELHFAYIELGGLRIGLDESIFNYWTDYFGGVINDDTLNPLAYSRTNAISYTFSSGNGFSAILGLEQGNKDGDKEGFRYGNKDGDPVIRPLSQQIDHYKPHVVAGVKYAQGWGSISAVAAYDAYYSEWAAKARFDVNLNDHLSLWAMGGYKSMKDYYTTDGEYPSSAEPWKIYRQISSIYGDWGGHWAVWGGGTYKFTPQTSFNFQLAYEAAKTFSSSVNLAHEIVPGLKVTPELTYISWNDGYGYKDPNRPTADYTSLKGRNAFQGMVRLQRSF